ncbi:MAG: class I SAM-dependent methyltransferase [Promethearchaeota archaeon]
MGKKILDLGCGKNKVKNSIGFDCIDLDGVDIVGDLLEPLPFENSEFDVVYLDNVLEHFDDITGILKEVHRITKPTGRILIMVPYYNSPLAFMDPTHKRAFNYKTFDYYSENSSWNYYFDFKFKIVKKQLITTRLGSFIPKRFLLKLSQYFGNLIMFMVVVLQPIK